MPGLPFAPTSAGTGRAHHDGRAGPAGADAVLPFEAAEEMANILQVREPISPGRHIGKRGEDVQPGRVVLTKRSRAQAARRRPFAALGVAAVPVVRRPRVEILTTGDELLPAGAKPEGCRIVDSNSVMLAALTRRDGALATVLPLFARREKSCTMPCGKARLTFCSSRVAARLARKTCPGALAELGELCVHGVALRPASPAGLGFLGTRPVFSAAGNPVSCLCAYDLFAGRAIRRLGGRSPQMPYRSERLPLAAKIASAVGRVDYARCASWAGAPSPLR